MNTSGGFVRPSDPLPPISRLDPEKMRIETANGHRTTTNGTFNNASMVSPTYMYSGPPPPYSYPAPTTSLPAPVPPDTLSSPTEPRRPLNEKDEVAQQHRQSLPSIQEALADQKYPLSPSATQHPLPPPPPPPSVPVSFSHASTPSHPPSTLDSARTLPAGGYAEHRQSAMHPHPIQSHQSPLAASHPAPYPSSHPENGHSAQPPAVLPPSTSRQIDGPHSGPRMNDDRMHISPRHENEPSSASSLHAPLSSYPTFAPHYPFQSQTTTHPPAHPPSSPYRTSSMESSHLSYSQSRFDAPEVARVDETRKQGLKGSHGEIYGYSVRRHLEYFDLEASLSGIMEGSGRLFDIARYHQTRAKESRAENHTTTPLPTLDECDRMLQHNQNVQSNLTNMREMLLTQQQSAASQHAQSQRFKGPVDYEGDDGSMYEEPKSGGGLGADSKKRRARAAPPGRCHSCNRAETPEWRRGPDGARTLCNACGLHYAKLTRKTKAAMHGSTMRPKSVDSPPPP